MKQNEKIFLLYSANSKEQIKALLVIAENEQLARELAERFE